MVQVGKYVQKHMDPMGYIKKRGDVTKISSELLIGDFHPPFPSDHLSNEKKGPWLFRVYRR